MVNRHIAQDCPGSVLYDIDIFSILAIGFIELLMHVSSDLFRLMYCELLKKINL